MSKAQNQAASVAKRGLTGSSVLKKTMEDYNAATDGELMDRSKFNMIMGGCLLWGFLVNAIICVAFGGAISAAVEENPSLLFGILIGYVVLAIAGVLINVKSDKPAISFLGYNMVVLPLGVMLSVILTAYPVMTIAYAFVATAATTALMMAVAGLKPEFFLSMGRGLIFALLIAIVVELVCTFLFPGALGILDYVVAIIFCGYIGFDWVRSQTVPATLDNAIDCACALYLDIINLFIRLVEIFGRK